MYTIHGGNLDAVEREFGIPKERITDFSGNVNPLGPPAPVLRAIAENVGAITRYPDVEYRALRQGIAKYAGTDAEYIIPGNGSTELISAFIRAISPETAVIVSPAYSEYERAVALAGGTVRLFPLRQEDEFELNTKELIKFTKDASLLVICNPNNPTGTALTADRLAEVLTALPETAVMVDETYAEFTDAPIQSAKLLDHFPNLFTVRGTSKFFAVPGLRLGYAMCKNKKTRQDILTRKDPWSVNILSVIAGEALFSAPGMDEYIKKTKALASEWRKLFGYSNDRLRLYKSHANFILARIESDVSAEYVCGRLLKEFDMLVRNAASFPYLDNRFFRFCMQTPDKNARLVSALEEIL